MTDFMTPTLNTPGGRNAYWDQKEEDELLAAARTKTFDPPRVVIETTPK